MGNSIYEMIGYIIIAGFVGTIILGILIRLFEYFFIGIIFLIIVILSMFAIHIIEEYGVWISIPNMGGIIPIILGIVLSLAVGIYIFRKVKKINNVKFYKK